MTLKQRPNVLNGGERDINNTFETRYISKPEFYRDLVYNFPEFTNKHNIREQTRNLLSGTERLG